MSTSLWQPASVHGAPAGDIQIRIAACDGHALLSVANDGPPIPDEEVGKLFTPYYRSRGAAPGGHGLGLAIVKEIVDQHQASIRLRRKEDGQGTVVEASLPRVGTQVLTREKMCFWLPEPACCCVGSCLQCSHCGALAALCQRRM